MVRQRARIIWTNLQIANNLTYPDTDVHLYDISAYVPPTCTGIFVNGVRRTGTSGKLKVRSRPQVDTGMSKIEDFEPFSAIGIVDQKLEVALETANIEYDLWISGYVTETRISGEKA